ncbi:MAG TPA: hypothetical protein VFJ78_03900 [Gaiellaceae bacterium]|nr:hypothetical protein [Gaiellaceae bacterium]
MTHRLVAGAVLLVAGLAAVLLASDVRAWRDAVDRGDAVYLASPRAATWRPDTTLGGLAARLLRADDDLAARRALKLYRAAATTQLRLDNATQVQTARAAAQDALLATHSSLSSTLLGILTFGRNATGTSEDQLDGAVADFTDAVRSDPTNDAAKFDLELLLRASAASGTRPGEGVGGGFGRGGRRGAGGGSPGKGY